MPIRSDAPLIKHLTKTYGADTARSWQSYPLVLLPNDGFVDHIRYHFMEYLQTDPRNFRSYETFPWPAVVLDFQEGHKELIGSLEVESSGWSRTQLQSQFPHLSQEDLLVFVRRTLIARRWYVRIRSRQAVDRATYTDPWTHLVREPYTGKNIQTWTESEEAPVEYVVECFEHHESFREVAGRGLDHWGSMGSTHPLCFSLIWYNKTVYTGTRKCSVNCSLCRSEAGNQLSDIYGRFIRSIMHYFGQCSEYITRVQPPQTSLPDKTRTFILAKPWLDEQQAHYILLSPERMHEYMAPEQRLKYVSLTTPSGTHASPKPHARRGHWRRLIHDRWERNSDGSIRVLWVKPSWIGPTRWTDEQGNTYQVDLTSLTVPDTSGDVYKVRA